MRLIDADELKDIKRLYHFREQYDDNLFDHIINQLPTIDAVEVVRCKDCKYHITHDKMNGCKIWWGWANDDNRFCSYGERIEEV